MLIQKQFSRPVTIMRFVSEGTIEEGMYEVAKEKLKLEQQVTGDEGKHRNFKNAILLIK